MPLKWIRGCNPYVVNYFAKLRLGANADPLRMNASARNLKQKIAQGEPVELGGQKLDEHAIEEASTRLRNGAARAEELLLVHAPGQSEQQAPNQLVAKLKQAASLPDQREEHPLLHPAAVFWFLPSPGTEGMTLPPPEALGLVAPGDAADLELDIVFDE